MSVFMIFRTDLTNQIAVNEVLSMKTIIHGNLIGFSPAFPSSLQFTFALTRESV